MKKIHPALFFILLNFLTGCSSVYLNTLESMGIPKREVMVHRVEKARDTQEETKEQFKSALHQFMTVSAFDGGDMEEIYNKLNDEYEASIKKSEQVKDRIEDIESVSDALFDEWEAELEQYSSSNLRRSSQQKLDQTRNHYHQLITAMKRAESKIKPVLAVFNDQLLFLKHNLNAQAISSLKGELHSVESDVASLIIAMEQSIDEANAFIRTMESN